MNVFTDVYSKSVELLKVSCLDDSWKSIETDLKSLLDADGPNSAKAKVLDDLRDRLSKAGKGKAVAKIAIAEEVIKASQSGSPGFQDRAALIKTMQHFHMVQKKGGQSVWVVDPPKAYAAWPFDQLAGKSEPELKTELQAEGDVFGKGNRKMMSDALQLARKWSADVQVKLGTPNAKTLEKIQRWFHEQGASENDVAATAALLGEGFKKIHACCNSSSIIFSDRPHLRTSGAWDNVYASVNSADVMPVIYIFQVFLNTGKRNALGGIPKLWLCALTVIHELTHKLVNTEDIRYDDDGLKPGASFTTEQARKNADTWAYFAADMVGALTKGTLTKVLV